MGRHNTDAMHARAGIGLPTPLPPPSLSFFFLSFPIPKYNNIKVFHIFVLEEFGWGWEGDQP